MVGRLPAQPNFSMASQRQAPVILWCGWSATPIASSKPWLGFASSWAERLSRDEQRLVLPSPPRKRGSRVAAREFGFMNFRFRGNDAYLY